MRIASEALKVPMTRLLATNSTDASFASKIPTATKPSGVGVVDLNALPSTNIRFMPFGAGSDNDTFVMRVIAWNYAGTPGGDALWIPTSVAEYTCTLSAAVGVAGKVCVATDRFADTMVIVANMGTDGQGVTKFSPANDTLAWIVVNMEGALLLEVVFDMTGATSGNCLYQPI